jgi:hypothetical protein
MSGVLAGKSGVHESTSPFVSLIAKKILLKRKRVMAGTTDAESGKHSYIPSDFQT